MRETTFHFMSPISWYFSRKFADFAGLFMCFAATVLFALLFLQDMRKNTYELLHTKPISAAGYVAGKAAGGFLVSLLVLGFLTLLFWLACLICTRKAGFVNRLGDFLQAAILYVIPDLLMIVCVYTFVSILFQNPIPAAPMLILYMIYSNMGKVGQDQAGVYYIQPLSIMTRFEGTLFQVTSPPDILVNQLFLLVSSSAMLLCSILIWRRRRV